MGSEDLEREAEENVPKPPPTFNGALSKFIFSATAQETRTTGSATTQTAAFPRKRATQTLEQGREELPVGGKATIKPKKKRRKHTGYAPPSTYAHLSGIADALSSNLICIFIGFNPGLATATAGHAYASPTNLFWGLLHSSGCTPDRQLPPAMDEHLPELYSLGHTNLVSRPSRDAAELSKEEMVEAVPKLEEKMRRWRPESICLVGKAIWEAIWRSKTGGGIKKREFAWGWQEMKFAGEKDWEGCRAFVVPSTSGLVAAYSTEFKKAIWKELGDWVQERRKERGETAPRSGEVTSRFF